MNFGGHPHEWYPLTEGPVIDLHVLPPDQAVAGAVDRLLRIPRGAQVEFLAGRDLHLVWQEISDLRPSEFPFTIVQDGPPRWRMQVTRHQVASTP